MFDPFISPALSTVHALLVVLSAGTAPVMGGASTAVALVLVTLVVRACLLPFAVRVMRAERARRALSPIFAELRRRHRDDPARLARELRAAHRQAGISPFAGLAPALAQSPVLYVLYRLCSVPLVAGGPNLLFAADLAGVRLSAHAWTFVAGGTAGAPALAVLFVVASALVAVAILTSRQQLRRLDDDVPGPARAVVRVMPYGTVAFALMVPFAVSLYLLTSTAWTLAERTVLLRFF